MLFKLVSLGGLPGKKELSFDEKRELNNFVQSSDALYQAKEVAFALICGDHAVVKANLPALLVDDKQLDSIRFSEGLTFSHLAVAVGDVEMLAYLLEKGASLDVEKHSGLTLQHWAASFGQLDILEYLLSKNSDILATSDAMWVAGVEDAFFATPLHLAIDSGHQHIIEYMISIEPDIIKESDNVYNLFLSIANSEVVDVGVIKLLLDQNVLTANNDMIVYACTTLVTKGEFEAFKVLLDKFAGELNDSEVLECIDFLPSDMTLGPVLELKNGDDEARFAKVESFLRNGLSRYNAVEFFVDSLLYYACQDCLEKNDLDGFKQLINTFGGDLVSVNYVRLISQSDSVDALRFLISKEGRFPTSLDGMVDGTPWSYFVFLNCSLNVFEYLVSKSTAPCVNTNPMARNPLETIFLHPDNDPNRSFDESELASISKRAEIRLKMLFRCLELDLISKDQNDDIQFRFTDTDRARYNNNDQFRPAILPDSFDGFLVMIQQFIDLEPIEKSVVTDPTTLLTKFFGETQGFSVVEDVKSKGFEGFLDKRFLGELKKFVIQPFVKEVRDVLTSVFSIGGKRDFVNSVMLVSDRNRNGNRRVSSAQQPSLSILPHEMWQFIAAMALIDGFRCESDRVRDSYVAVGSFC